MRTINKLTKLVLSFLLVITCINFSVVQAEDGSDENYSEPTAVETISEEPVAEEPVIEEAAPVEEEKQEEVTPEVIEEAKVEEENNTPEIEAEPATQEETVEPEVQHEAPVAPEVQKVETVEEVKVTVVVSYVDESDHPLTDPITGSYPIEYRLDENVDAFKSFDGYAFEKMIVNDDAKNTISKDDVQKNGLRITKDMTSLKLVYQKMNLESNENKEVIPEVTEEAVEEAEPESSTNETELFAFDQTAFAGNVTVHVTAAEGVLPSGAQLIVKRVTRKAILNAVEETVTEKDKEVDSAIALDITIVNADGIEIQPNGPVNISFENAAVSGDEINVYHVTDDASAVTEVATNTQSFDTNHFSIYVITGEKEVSLTTFNFVANGNIISTQTVKTGDTLITPTAPDMDGKVFVGWYDGETKFEDFNIALTISETTTREITAKYEDALYVYFYNPAGTQIMRTEKVSDHYTHDFTNVSYEVDATHKIVGWAAEKNGTTNIADSIAVPTDKTSINVYAIIKEGYWISFDSDGGSIVDSQFVLHGDKLVLGKDTTPTKPGYTFDGWYNDSGKVENVATVTTPMTLKAHWNAAKVSYTVIHWWENADDDGYSFHESENKTGMTGKEANAKAKSYDGFTAKSVTKKTIKGDGSTIVSVYYKRNVYDVKFYSYSTPGFLWDPGTPSKEYVDLRITAKYGQDISKKWPTYKGSSTWRTNDGSGAYQVNIGTMPLEGAKFYGPKTGNGSETAYYYVEVLPGEPSDVTKDGTRYKLDHKDMSPGQGYYVTKEDQYPLTGFTFNKESSTKIEGDYDNAKFYYTRNTYKIKFINKGKEDKSVEKKYEQSISSENYTPTRPSSLLDYYTFDGWYDNELCEGEAFDFNGKKMPAQNVTLYAKWTAKKINLTYNLNNPEGDVVKGSKNVEAGTIANTVLPSATTTSDYSFAGWYYADGNGNITSDAYNTNGAITKDTSVIGKWLYNGELRVVYDPGTEGSKAKVPTDSNIYAGGAKVTVAKNATTTSKKKFLGWKLNGNLYHPGDAFEVNKDIANKDNQIILTATWGNAETSTTLTYDPGNGRGSVQTVPVNPTVPFKNNESVILKSEKDLGYQAPETEGKEYYFAGWATSMDDAINGKATYAAGQSVHVDVDGENVLYATWIEKTVITLVAKSKTVTYNGEAQSVEDFQDVADGYNVSGLSAKATGTNAGEYTTEIKGTAKVTKDRKDVTEKVVVNVVPGQLTISKRDVTLTSGSASKVYDKTALTNDTVTVSGGGFVKDEGATYDVTGSRTKVGTSKNTFTYELKSNTTASNYNITKVEGDLVVTAQDGEVVVTITGHSDSVEYDGNEKTVSGYDVAITEGSKYTTDDFTFNGNAEAKGTEAGTYPMNLAADQFTNTNGNYTQVTFIVNDGTLTITPKSINPDDEKNGITVTDPINSTYDGNEHINGLTVTDAKLNTTLVEGTDYTLTYSGDLTNVGTVTITIKGIGNYTGTVVRTYAITPAPLSITTDSANKVYDGNPLTADGRIAGLVNNEKVTFTVTGSQTTVGTSDNKYTLEFDQTAKEGNYSIADKDIHIGKLTVTQQTIDPEDPDPEKYLGVTVDTPSDVTYDGNEHKWTPTVSDADDKALTEGTDYTVSYDTADFTNVHTITVTIEGIGNYTGTVVRTYAITPAEVTVTANNANKVYGENDPELKATVTGTLNNDTVDYTVTRDSGEDVGTYAIHVTGEENQGNYKVTYTPGTFEITKSGELILTAELTGESATKVYDGNPLTGGATANVKEGTTITYSTDGGATWTTEVPSITNVGTLNITARAENPNYEPAETTYSLTVTHATATVTAENKTKVYGTADLELTATVSGTLGNDTVAYTLAREAGENVGKYKITVTGEENQGNYKVTYTPGTFEITPKSITPDGPDTPEEKKTGITVTAPEGSKYDGEEHKNKPTVTDTKTGKTLTEGTDYTLTYSEDVTNAGTVTVTVTGIGNYTGEFDVTYEITKRDVVLTSATDSKPYDGTALRNENVEVTGDGFAVGEGATFAVIGTITNVGTKANTFGYTLNKNTLASNYNISTELGTLTITPKSIIPDGPETPDDEKTGITVENPGDVKYDGKDHAEKPVVKDEKTGVTLEEGKDYEIVYPDDIKNAGEITATVVGKGDYEGSFEIKYNITKRDVTFTSATDSKQYDGNALTNGNVEITGDGFIEGEGAEYKVTGTQTQVGNSANEFEYTLNENTLASNYDITKVVGTLTVTAAPAPETPEKPKPEVKKSVDTSDDNNIVFYGNAFFMAMITLAGIIVLRKKSS